MREVFHLIRAGCHRASLKTSLKCAGVETLVLSLDPAGAAGGVAQLGALSIGIALAGGISAAGLFQINRGAK